MGVKSRPFKALTMGVLLVLVFSLGGCGQAQRKPQKPGDGRSGQKAKPPKELTRIQTGLERIYEALKPLQTGTAEQIQRVQKEGAGDGKDRGGEKGKQGAGGGKEQGGEKQKSGQKSGEGGTGGTSTAEQVNWAKLHSQSVGLHEQWNAFEPNAMKAGADPEAVRGFEDQLNALSNKLAMQDRYGSQLAANNAAAYLPDFLRLFDDKTPPDLFRLRYLARSIALKVEMDDWAGAEQDLAAMPAVWSRARTEAKGAKESDIGRIQHAITDLRDAVKARDKIVVMLKENVLEKNIKALDGTLRGEI